VDLCAGVAECRARAKKPRFAAHLTNVRSGPITLIRCPKHHDGLRRPRQHRAFPQLNNSHSRDLPLVDQPFQHLRREVRQPQPPAEMTLCEVHSDGEIPHGAELSGLHAPPPSPCAADGNTVRSAFERMRASTDRMMMCQLGEREASCLVWVNKQQNSHLGWI